MRKPWFVKTNNDIVKTNALTLRPDFCIVKKHPLRFLLESPYVHKEQP